MAKKGMKRIDRTHTKPKNDVESVPEIQGKAKHTNQPANPIMESAVSPSEKMFTKTPLAKERPISSVYPVIDTDLARDNVENDLSDADLQDL